MNVIPEVAKAKDVTDRRTAQLHSDLLDAAAELLAEQSSLDKVSLGAVAGRAGVSPTAVYRHFDDHLAVMRGRSTAAGPSSRRRSPSMSRTSPTPSGDSPAWASATSVSRRRSRASTG